MIDVKSTFKTLRASLLQEGYQHDSTLTNLYEQFVARHAALQMYIDQAIQYVRYNARSGVERDFCIP